MAPPRTGFVGGAVTRRSGSSLRSGLRPYPSGRQPAPGRSPGSARPTPGTRHLPPATRKPVRGASPAWALLEIDGKAPGGRSLERPSCGRPPVGLTFGLARGPYADQKWTVAGTVAPVLLERKVPPRDPKGERGRGEGDQGARRGGFGSEIAPSVGRLSDPPFEWKGAF